MGPPRSQDEPEVMSEINTTPLIDVMLVLLIMLIITIPIQTHSLPLDMPNGPPPATAQPPEVVRLEIGADGAIRWNGQVLAERGALEEKLRAVAATADPPEIHLRPDRHSAYKHLAMVMAAAQQQGVRRIGIVGAEQFPP